MMLNDSEDETTQGEVERWWQSATLICTMPPGFESPFEPLRARCASLEAPCRSFSRASHEKLALTSSPSPLRGLEKGSEARVRWGCTFQVVPA